jgi:hypothetical protein
VAAALLFHPLRLYCVEPRCCGLAAPIPKSGRLQVHEKPANAWLLPCFFIRFALPRRGTLLRIGCADPKKGRLQAHEKPATAWLELFLSASLYCIEARCCGLAAPIPKKGRLQAHEKPVAALPRFFIASA